ncbi:hypothetical protein XarCFBP6762_21455, partial [Xanthomonas arboricola]
EIALTEIVVHLLVRRHATADDAAQRRLSLYPYFPIGYMSWMHQGGAYEPALGGIVCRSVAPYQKVDDYFRQRDF